ncbi:MAG TPA: peptidylprolyl isomerase, partial [Gemmatimonadales bacterium]|nr:peptidylprolyl isomerase [Gemmatimonadales bacterium]
AAGPDTVTLETSRGVIVLEVDPVRAPESVANFLKHVRAHFYDGLIFHRIEPTFVIQAGAVTEQAGERTSTVFPVRNEAQNGLKNLRGTVAMARTSDPHSATSEFFINLKDNAGLDHRSATIEGWGYAVFGRVIQGMDVVDAIAATPTTRRGQYRTWPTTPTVIRRAYVGAPAPAPTS